MEGGAVSLPELRDPSTPARVREQGARRHNGHPIEVESCNLDFTPETAMNCANTFVEARW